MMLLSLPIAVRASAGSGESTRISAMAVPPLRFLDSVKLFPDRAHLVGAYSLGKAQRVIAMIRKAGYDVATTETALGVEGMTCASCVSRFETGVSCCLLNVSMP